MWKNIILTANGFQYNTAHALYAFGSLRFQTHTLKICKDKPVPLQAWSDPEDSRKLRFPDLMTTTQDSGNFISLTRRPPSPPGNTPSTHFC